MRYGAGILPVCPPTGRALVLLRSEAVNHPLTWAAAGGGDEPDDNGRPIVTAVREFTEETGHFPSDYVAPLASTRSPNGLFHLFISIESKEFRPVLNFENDAAMWLNFGELMALPDKHPVFAAQMANKDVQAVLFEILNTIPSGGLP